MPQKLHIFGSLCISPAQSHGTGYGGDTPQSIGSFKLNLKPTTSLLFTPSLLKTVFLAFPARTHTQQKMSTRAHRNTHILNQTICSVCIVIQTHGLTLEKNRIYPHPSAWTCCGVFLRHSLCHQEKLCVVKTLK